MASLAPAAATVQNSPPSVRSRPDLRLWALCLAAASLSWSKAGLSIGCGLLILTSLAYWRPVGTFRTRLGASTALFMIPLVISALHSEKVAQGFGEVSSFWPLLFLFLGAAAIRDSRHPRALLWVFLTSSSLATIPTLSHMWKLAMVADYPRLWPELPTNVWLYTLSMCTGAILSLVLLRSRRSWCGRLTLLGSFFLHGAAVIGAQRRMMMLILGVILAAMGPVFIRSRRWRLGILVVLIGSFALLASQDQRFRQLTSIKSLLEAEKSRTTLWEIGWQTFKREPLLGTGIGDFRDELHALADQDTAGKYAGAKLQHPHCHNNFLHIMAISGLLGLLGFVQWIFLLPVILIKGFKRHQEAVVIGLAAWGFLFLGGLPDAPLFSSSRLSSFAIMFGYAWGILLRPSTEASPKAP